MMAFRWVMATGATRGRFSVGDRRRADGRTGPGITVSGRVRPRGHRRGDRRLQRASLPATGRRPGVRRSFREAGCQRPDLGRPGQAGRRAPEVSSTHPASRRRALRHPVETGPTMYLPHSQKYLPGYLTTGLPEFVEYFAQNHVQLPLAKGDVVFFNPALFQWCRHQSDCRRPADGQSAANVLGARTRAGECRPDQGDHLPSLRPCWPRRASGASASEIANVIAASAEGVPVPTNRI